MCSNPLCSEWPSCHWTHSEVDPARIERCTKSLSIPPELARCLLLREINTRGEAKQFLNPRLSDCTPPDALPGITEAAQIIHQHITQKHKIIVFGDYDADGITASAILSRVILALGGNCAAFIPDRISEGYGFTVPALQRCITEYNTIDLIVTVDCGISQHDACNDAARQGIDVVVTDHHALAGDPPTSARVCVNPCLPRTPAPLAHLCGAGVAFKLAHQLARIALAPTQGRSLIESVLPLAAIGTVADLVPLTGENRIIVCHGLRIMNTPGCGGNPGLHALKFKIGVAGHLTSSSLAFLIGPHINAAGRIASPSTALKLLMSKSNAEALPLAAQLTEHNDDRKEEEANAVLEAKSGINVILEHYPNSLVLFNPAWHPGIVGLVASRLLSAYRRPTIIFTQTEDGVLRGSARSPEHHELNLMDILNRCSPYLLHFGGHRVAAGLSLHESQLDNFRTAFDNACASFTKTLDLRQELAIDAWTTPSELGIDLFQRLNQLEPCGVANPEPRLGIRKLTLKANPESFGKTAEHWTLSFVETKYRGIIFQKDDVPFRAGDQIDVVFNLSISQYGDVQLIIKDAMMWASAEHASN